MSGTDTVVLLAALLIVLFVIGIGAWVVVNTPASGSDETSKVRFGAAACTGIMVLVVFIIVLYVLIPTGAGKDVFHIVFPALNALAGGIVGYVLGGRKKKDNS